MIANNPQHEVTSEALTPNEMTELLNLFKAIIYRKDSVPDMLQAVYNQNLKLLSSQLSFRFAPYRRQNQTQCFCHFNHEYTRYLSCDGVLPELLEEIEENVIRGHCRHTEVTDPTEAISRAHTSLKLMNAAISVGDSDTVRFLLEKGENLKEFVGYFNLQPVHMAVLKGERGILNNFLQLESGSVDLNIEAYYAFLSEDILELKSYSPLDMAIAMSFQDITKDLLAFYPKSIQQGVALHALNLSIVNKEFEFVKLLVSQNIKPNLESLSQCILKGDSEMLELLLPLSKEVLNSMRLPYPPIEMLAFAVKLKNRGAVELLLQHGVTPNYRKSPKSFVDIPLLRAVLQNDPKMVKILLEHHAQMNETVNGYTIADLSICLGFKECTDLLLAAGFQESVRSRKGSPFIAVCAVRGFKFLFNELSENLLTALSSRGYDINESDEDGDTCLHQAVRNLPLQVVETLLRLGADVNKANKYGATPFWEAIRRNQMSIIKECLFYNPNLEVRGASKYCATLKSVLQLTVEHSFIFMSKKGEEEPGRESTIRSLKVSPRNKSKPSYVVTDKEEQYNLLSTVALLLHCGYNVHKDDTSNLPLEAEDSKTTTMINSFLTKPRPLLTLCRDALRRSYPGAILHAVVENINFPNSMKEFLLLENMLGEVVVTSESFTGI